MTDRLNPRDEEQYLVRLLFAATTTNLRDEALLSVDPEEFASAALGGLWEAARRVQAADKRITRRAVVAAAESTGAEQALARVGDAVPRPGDFSGAVAEVKRCAQLRALMETTVRIQQRAMVAEDPSQALAWAHEELGKLDQDGEVPHSHDFGDLLDRFDEALKTRTDYRVVPTPWDEVNDRIAGGLHAGRMYVVGARPGEGKSIAGHQLAEHAASLGHPGVVFSVEMGDLEVTGRIVANGASIEMGEISRRDLSDHSWIQFQEYRERAHEYPLTVNDRPDLSLSYIAAECRRLKRRKGLDVVVVDYLQLLQAERSLPREQQVAHVSRTLKKLSRELECAVVVPAQLNRKPTERGKPQLSDLRESGAIEADADVVVLLSRVVDEEGLPTGMLGLSIPKNRHGRVGELELPWRPHYSRIG